MSILNMAPLLILLTVAQKTHLISRRSKTSNNGYLEQIQGRLPIAVVLTNQRKLKRLPGSTLVRFSVQNLGSWGLGLAESCVPRCLGMP